MKAIQLAVEIHPSAKPKSGRPKPGRLRRAQSRLFKFVQGDHYWYRLTVSNVGDEPVGPEDIQTFSVIWRYTVGQSNSYTFAFPTKIDAGQKHTFDRVHHDVLSSGFALLYVDAFRPNAPVKLEFRDSRGQVVPFDAEGFVRSRRGTFSRSTSAWAFENFYALSGTEVNQFILIVIAIVAFVLNAAFGILNYFK